MKKATALGTKVFLKDVSFGPSSKNSTPENVQPGFKFIRTLLLGAPHVGRMHTRVFTWELNLRSGWNHGDRIFFPLKN
jgi:hypothetical protein